MGLEQLIDIERRLMIRRERERQIARGEALVQQALMAIEASRQEVLRSRMLRRAT
jgi:CYTH domain-containing protein